MSKQLLNSIERFLCGDADVHTFVDKYIDDWRAERDSDELLLEADKKLI